LRRDAGQQCSGQRQYRRRIGHAERLVDQGIVVVTAAGNLGKRNGHTLYGGITAPGNAPWVLTVGADSHQGTIDRTDDVMTDYSSRGPTAIDFNAKPDVCAPGAGIVSTASPASTLFQSGLLSTPSWLIQSWNCTNRTEQ
jgi:subtilase family serine protease